MGPFRGSAGDKEPRGGRHAGEPKVYNQKARDQERTAKVVKGKQDKGKGDKGKGRK